MNAITLHDAFVAQGCAARAAPVRAVSVGAGAIWAHVYDAVTTRGGGYVQGGGCMTVGVAGLVQSGGFGSFSKRVRPRGGSLLEAEVVTADGEVRIANACSHPDLFWALKGGGGGSFGVVTRLTLRVHPLPEDFGAVNITIKAASPAAFRRLVGLIVDFYAEHLIEPALGRADPLAARQRRSRIAMVFQGLTRGQAQAVWQPFLDAVDAAPRGLPDRVLAAEDRLDVGARRSGRRPSSSARSASSSATTGPARRRPTCSGPATRGRPARSCTATSRPGCRRRCCSRARRAALADALFAASRHWGVSLHVNKGLAGAPAEAIVAAARDTAMNPAVARCLRARDHRRRRAAGLSGRRRATSPTSPRRASAAQAIGRARGRAAQAGADSPARTCRRATTSRRDWQQRVLGQRTTRGCWR